MNKIEIYKFFNTYQAKIDEHTHLCDVHKDLAEYILALQKENEQLQEKNENYRASVQALKIENDKKDRIIKEAIDYIKNNTYKCQWGDLEQDNEDINISDDLTETEFIEDLLQILERTDK